MKKVFTVLAIFLSCILYPQQANDNHATEVSPIIATNSTISKPMVNQLISLIQGKQDLTSLKKQLTEKIINSQMAFNR